MEKDLIVKIKERNQDEGEALIQIAKADAKRFPWLTKETRQEMKEASRTIEDYKITDYEKYRDLLGKLKEYRGGWREEDFKELERDTNKKFAENHRRLSLLSELIKIKKLNPPPKLEQLIEKYSAEGKTPKGTTVEFIMRYVTAEGDYKFLERGLKFFDWKLVAFLTQSKESELFESLADDEKFSKLEDSIKRIEKTYRRKLKFGRVGANLLSLLQPEYVEEILAQKGKIGKLEDYYNLNFEHIDEFDRINTLSKNGNIEKILSPKFKEKMDKIRKAYGLKGFKSLKVLLNWGKASDRDFEKFSSEKFVKGIENFGKKIGRDKAEIIDYFSETDGLSLLNSDNVRELLKEEVVFSSDVKEANLDMREIFGNFPSSGGELTLWGRIRPTQTRDIATYATFGRFGPDREPYPGWEIIAAARNVLEQDLGRHILNQEFLTRGIEGEPGFKKGGEMFDYVKRNLPSHFKGRFSKVFEVLEERGREGKEIESKYGDIDNSFTAGAYARFDSQLNIPRSYDRITELGKREYLEIYDKLDRGFMAPSDISLLIGKGVEELYNFMTEKKLYFEEESRNLSYLVLHKDVLSEDEIKILKGKIKNILGPIKIMETFYNYPSGVYPNDPPLHGGVRGGYPPPWSPRAAPLRDRVFRRFKAGRKEMFANVKEYALNNTGVELAKPRDQLKVRLYAFSDRPEPKNLAEEGFSVEIERNDETKILDTKETENLLRGLKEYTLFTLYLKNSPLLEVKKVD